MALPLTGPLPPPETLRFFALNVSTFANNGDATWGSVPLPRGANVLFNFTRWGQSYTIPTSVVSGAQWLWSANVALNGGSGVATLDIDVVCSGLRFIFPFANSWWGTANAGGPYVTLSLLDREGRAVRPRQAWVGNVNLRDYIQNTFTNAIQEPYAATVWSVAVVPSLGRAKRLDMQWFNVTGDGRTTAGGDDGFTVLRVSDTGGPGFQRIFIAALTLATTEGGWCTGPLIAPVAGLPGGPAAGPPAAGIAVGVVVPLALLAAALVGAYYWRRRSMPPPPPVTSAPPGKPQLAASFRPATSVFPRTGFAREVPTSWREAKARGTLTRAQWERYMHECLPEAHAAHVIALADAADNDG